MKKLFGKKYEYVEKVGENYVVIINMGKQTSGLLDKNGNIIIEPIYSGICIKEKQRIGGYIYAEKDNIFFPLTEDFKFIGKGLPYHRGQFTDKEWDEYFNNSLKDEEL